MARLTKWIVEAMVDALEKDQDICLVLAGPSPSSVKYLRITRDGRKWVFQRYLYYRVTGIDPDPAWAMIPDCKTVGCVNPFHFRFARSRRPLVRDTCPNGHDYSPDNLINRSGHKCRKCYEARLARERKYPWPRGWCRKGHKLTPDNVYVRKHADGTSERICRRCQLDRQHAYTARKRRESRDATNTPLDWGSGPTDVSTQRGDDQRDPRNGRGTKEHVA